MSTETHPSQDISSIYQITQCSDNNPLAQNEELRSEYKVWGTDIDISVVITKVKKFLECNIFTVEGNVERDY